METHFHRYEAFSGDVVGDNAMHHCIVILYGRGWLFVFLSSRVCRSVMASRKLMKRAVSLASAVEEMTALMVWVMVMTAPLLCGVAVLLDMKNVRPLYSEISILKDIMRNCGPQRPCRWRDM